MKEKMIPEIRFKGFTDTWEQRKLGELADIVRGASPRPIQDPKWFDENSEVGWLRISDVTEQNGRIKNLEQKISKAGQEKTRVLKEPHLLLSIAATVGKPVINYVKTGVHDGFLIFLNPTFEQEFLFQWLEMFRPLWKKYGQPGSQVNLNSELVRNQEIRIPIKEEQVKISNFFNQLDETITLQERKLDLLKEQKKGYLQKMFPKQNEKFPELRFEGYTDAWEQRKVSDIVKFHKQGFYTKESYSENNKYFLLRGTELTSNKLVLNDTPKINATEKDYNDFKVDKGDFLIVRSGTVGTYGIVYDDIKAIFGSYLINFRFDMGIVTNEFFGLFYQSNVFKNQLNKIIQKSSNVNINAENIKSTTITLPYIEEQQKISSFFKNLDDSITLQEHKVEQMKEMKKGFLQKLFV